MASAAGRVRVSQLQEGRRALRGHLLRVAQSVGELREDARSHGDVRVLHLRPRSAFGLSCRCLGSTRVRLRGGRDGSVPHQVKGQNRGS